MFAKWARNNGFYHEFVICIGFERCVGYGIELNKNRVISTLHIRIVPRKLHMLICFFNKNKKKLNLISTHNKKSLFLKDKNLKFVNIFQKKKKNSYYLNWDFRFIKLSYTQRHWIHATYQSVPTVAAFWNPRIKSNKSIPGVEDSKHAKVIVIR